MTRSVLGDEAQARFADARIAVVRRLGELARAERCAFVLVCGDVFESSQIERRTLARALEALASVPVPVYLLPGNHDPLDAASRLPLGRVPRRARPRTCTCSPTRRRAPWRPASSSWARRGSRGRPAENPALAALAELGPPGPLRILAAHGGLDALTPERGDATLLAARADRARARRGPAPLRGARRPPLADARSAPRAASRTRARPSPPTSTSASPARRSSSSSTATACARRAHRVGTWHFARPEPFELDRRRRPRRARRPAQRLRREGAHRAAPRAARPARPARGGAARRAARPRARSVRGARRARRSSSRRAPHRATSTTSRSPASRRARWRGSREQARGAAPECRRRARCARAARAAGRAARVRGRA